MAVAPGTEGGSDPELSTDDIVSAFQAKRRSKPDATPPAVSPSGPAPMQPRASPPASPVGGQSPSGSAASNAANPGSPPPSPSTMPPASPRPAPPPAEPAPKQPSAHEPTLVPRASEPSSQSALAVAPQPAHPPALLQPALAGGQPLTALSPILRLSDRLLHDKEISVRGSRKGRTVGIAVALVGLMLVVLDQALVAGGSYPVVPLTDIALVLLGLALVVIGALVAGICLFVPPHRRLRVRLAPSQEEEWARVQEDARKLRTLAVAGLCAAIVGLVLAAAAFALLLPPASTAMGAAGLVIGLAGAAVLAGAALRRGVLQRLYIQTLLLSRLEATGLGPSGAEKDARVAPVLTALDQLLGALPESAVRRFLASPEAESYLELMDELRGQGRKDG